MGSGSARRTAMAKRTVLRRPEQVQLFHRGSHIEIVQKWFGWHVILLTPFAMLFGAYGLAQLAINPLEENPGFYFLPALGIWLMYFAAAGWINRTHIFVSREKIAVRHRPIPSWGNKELDVSSLKQLYVKERPVSGGSIYEVRATTHNGRDIKLVGPITSEQAFYIEQEIEKYVGIEDIPVKGEIAE